MFFLKNDSKNVITNLLVKFKNLEIFIKTCEKSIREEKFLDLYIPELKIVIVGNYDYTISIYYKRDKDLLKIKKYIQIASLNILK